MGQLSGLVTGSCNAHGNRLDDYRSWTESDMMQRQQERREGSRKAWREKNRAVMRVGRLAH